MSRLSEHGIITDLTPVGGWRYPQAYLGGFTVIKPEHAPEGSYANRGEKLVEAVRLFRLQKGLEPEEPESDIAEFIRRVSPINDFYRGKPPQDIGQPRVRPKVPLIQEIRNWIERMIEKKPELVNNLEASERAAICMCCRQNVRWRTNCGECNQEVDNRGLILRGVATFTPDPALLACRLHKIALQPAVFIDRDFLPPRDANAPPPCWIPQK